jgi:excisionase family DNA binding protein
MTATARRLAPRLRTEDAAPLLGVSERKVQQMCQRGELRAVKVGTVWTLTEADVAAYLESRATATARATDRLRRHRRAPLPPPPVAAQPAPDVAAAVADLLRQRA